MSGGAFVGSFEAVRDFRTALVVFLHEIREVLTSQDLEIRRTLEWALEGEPKRWLQEVRKCEEAVTQAKIELERCRYTKLPGGEPASCVDERKELERCRQRRQYAEQKVEQVRKWGRQLAHEAAEYAARASQLSDLAEVDMAAAVAMLDRVLTSLEAYTAAEHTVQPASQPPARDTGSAARPLDRPLSAEASPSDEPPHDGAAEPPHPSDSDTREED